MAVISTNLKDLETLKRTDPPNVLPYLLYSKGTIYIRMGTVHIQTNSYDNTASGMVFDHSSKGVVGTNKILSTDDSGMAGWVTASTEVKNEKMTNVGKDLMTLWMRGNSVYHPNTIAIGTGSTAYSVEDTALVSENSRYTMLYQDFDSDLEHQMKHILWFNSDNVNIRELGLFNNLTGSGTMFNRTVIPSLVKTNTTAVKIILHELFHALLPFTHAGITLINAWTIGYGIFSVYGFSSLGDPYIHWGTGTTALSQSDTTLEGDVFSQIIDDVTTSYFATTFTSLLLSGDANGNTLTRAALFDINNNLMILESGYANIEKTADKTIQTEFVIDIN